MPITSIDSYPAVMADFGLHWWQVNDSLTGVGWHGERFVSARNRFGWPGKRVACKGGGE
jgi:hypothetical protein